MGLSTMRLRILVIAGVALSVGSVTAAPLGTAFTYQGLLNDAGLPATGAYDFQFKLFDASTGGVQIGSTVLKDDVAVTAGRFTTSLDFGAAAFAGQSRFLEIGVRPGASTGAYTVLGSRQELTPSPNALFATSAASATTVAGLTCTNNQVAKWSGSAWTCGTDTNSGGTVTSVTAGSGLSGGAITSSGTIAVAPLGITSAMIANGAIGSTKIADGAVGSAQVNAAQVQTRVTSACPPGLTIQTINLDGTVVCQTASAQAGFSTATLDAEGFVGIDTSIAIGADGLGLISYSDGAFSNLKAAHCSNAACTTATISTLDSVGQVGGFTSITIGGDGLGLISYYDFTNGDLKVAHCADIACSTANIATLDNVGDVGQYTSIAIGADGLGLISYYDNTNDDLKVAHCSNVTCSTASIATLDSLGNVGRYTSIAIGVDGRGLIIYNDGTAGDLKVAHCSDITCSTASAAIVDSTGGQHTAIAIGADGLGLISYLNGDGVKVAHCSNTVCSAATTSILDNTVFNLFGTSIDIGADGLGLIGYRGNPIGLAVAHCSNTACSAATSATLDLAGLAGYYPSVAIGADGLGLVSYFDAGNGDLKVAHCPNLECRPAVTSVAGGSGLVSGGTQGSTATLSVDFAGTGVAPTVARSDHNHDSAYWKLGGNSGTTPGTNFLGTIGGQALELRSTAGVGINKSAPTSALDVLGTGTMTGLAVNGSGFFTGGLGVGTSTTTNPFTLSTSAGTASGGNAGFNEVVGRVQRTGASHSAFAVDATAGQDAVLYLSSAGNAVWGLRNDADQSDGFQVRYQSASANVVRLWLTTDGRLSLGSSAPAAGRHIDTSTGAHLTTGGTWTNSSDRNLKENLVAVEGQDVLARLAALPVYRWNYRNEPDSLTHIGPTAQDFEAAFSLGGDGRSISTIDPSGIALAAIQELNRKTEALTAANSRLLEMSRQVNSNQREIALLKEQMSALLAAIRTEVKR